MKVLARFLILILMTSFVASCANVKNTLKNQDKKYLDAQTIPPLKIPPGTSSSSFHSYYPVSNKHYPREVEDVSLEPPGLMDN